MLSIEVAEGELNEDEEEEQEEDEEEQEDEYVPIR
jgi:hypothetical protein